MMRSGTHEARPADIFETTVPQVTTHGRKNNVGLDTLVNQGLNFLDEPLVGGLDP